MSKTTNNIIKAQKEDKERVVREQLKPIIFDSVNSGISQNTILKIVKELWRETYLYVDISDVNMNIGSDVLSYEKDFRKKAKAFIKNYGKFFMLFDEDPQFYEDLFWSMYVCLIVDNNITKELVFKRFTAFKYKYKHHTDFFDVDDYHRMSDSIRRNLKIDKKNHILSLSCLYGIEILNSYEYEYLKSTYSSTPMRSFYKKFALSCLTCIIYFM